MPYKYLKHIKSTLCLNGDLPKKDFFEQNKIIIATDGAADQLLKMNITPAVIIGDLDSVAHSAYPNSEILHIPDQDLSDFQKAMLYLKQKQLLPTIVCGVGGGFIDHILHNISVISENDCVFYAPPLIGHILSAPDTIQLQPAHNSKISLIAMGNARVNSFGLKWELTDARLEFPGSNSCFNRTVTKNVTIEMIEGKLLVLLYCEHIDDMGAL